MDIEQKNTDVYELITQLVKHTLEIDSSENGNLCTSPNSKLEIIRNLRSKAYEILLNKSDKIYDRGIYYYLNTFVCICKNKF